MTLSRLPVSYSRLSSAASHSPKSSTTAETGTFPRSETANKRNISAPQQTEQDPPHFESCGLRLLTKSWYSHLQERQGREVLEYALRHGGEVVARQVAVGVK